MFVTRNEVGLDTVALFLFVLGHFFDLGERKRWTLERGGLPSS